MVMYSPHYIPPSSSTDWLPSRALLLWRGASELEGNHLWIWPSRICCPYWNVWVKVPNAWLYGNTCWLRSLEFSSIPVSLVHRNDLFMAWAPLLFVCETDQQHLLMSTCMAGRGYYKWLLNRTVHTPLTPTSTAEDGFASNHPRHSS